MKREKPKNGWLICCEEVGDWSICSTEEELVDEIERRMLVNERLEAKAAGTALPVKIFELGENVHVELYGPTIASIIPVTKE